MEYQPFAEAKEYVHNLRLKNMKEWKEFCKSKNRPADILPIEKGVDQN